MEEPVLRPRKRSRSRSTAFSSDVADLAMIEGHLREGSAPAPLDKGKRARLDHQDVVESIERPNTPMVERPSTPIIKRPNTPIIARAPPDATSSQASPPTQGPQAESENAAGLNPRPGFFSRVAGLFYGPQAPKTERPEQGERAERAKEDNAPQDIQIPSEIRHLPEFHGLPLAPIEFADTTAIFPTSEPIHSHYMQNAALGALQALTTDAQEMPTREEMRIVVNSALRRLARGSTRSTPAAPADLARRTQENARLQEEYKTVQRAIGLQQENQAVEAERQKIEQDNLHADHLRETERQSELRIGELEREVHRLQERQ